MIKITFFLTRNGHACSDFLYGLEATTIGNRSPNSILSDLGIGRSINIGKQIIGKIPSKYVIISSALRNAVMTAHYQYRVHQRDPDKKIYILPFLNEIAAPGQSTLSLINAHNEYDLRDPFYNGENEYDIRNIEFGSPNSKINSDILFQHTTSQDISNYKRKILKNILLKNISNPSPQNFLMYFFDNFIDYAEEAKDEREDKYNFVIVSHEKYIMDFIKIFIPDISLNSIANNSIFKIDFEINKLALHSPTYDFMMTRSFIHNPTIKFITQFTKHNYFMENMASGDLFQSCCNISRDVYTNDYTFSSNCSKRLKYPVIYYINRPDMIERQIQDLVDNIDYVLLEQSITSQYTQHLSQYVPNLITQSVGAVSQYVPQSIQQYVSSDLRFSNASEIKKHFKDFLNGVEEIIEEWEDIEPRRTQQTLSSSQISLPPAIPTPAAQVIPTPARVFGVSRDTESTSSMPERRSDDFDDFDDFQGGMYRKYSKYIRKNK
jgi:hypothetical protein